VGNWLKRKNEVEFQRDPASSLYLKSQKIKHYLIASLVLKLKDPNNAKYCNLVPSILSFIYDFSVW
jgi:hypothetical protein